MDKKALGIMVLLHGAMAVHAQERRMTADEYIATYKHLAVSEMKRTKVPASITLAQGLLESGSGNSKLALEANNHFGIKCKKEWTGNTIRIDDDAPQECFRAYDRVEDSYRDHSEFLVNNKRYNPLFELRITDYKGWAKGLKACGYATNPRYPELLISQIERLRLHQYDDTTLSVTPIVAVNEEIDKSASSNNPEVKQVDVSGGSEQTSYPEMYTFNGSPAYIVREGDDLDRIARKQKLVPRLLRMFNDLEKGEAIPEGTVLYLKPKKRNGTTALHVVKEGEGMYYLSQVYRIKLSRLFKLNKMEMGTEPAPGETIYLQSRRSESPKLLTDASGVKRRGVQYILPSKQKEAASVSPTVQQTKPKSDDVAKRYKLDVDSTLPNRMDSLLHTLDEALAANNTAPSLSQLDHTSPKLQEEEKALMPEREEEKPELPRTQFSKPIGEVSAGSVEPDKSLIEDQITFVSKSALPATHTVVAGESLYRIAKLYDLTVDKLRRMNGLGDGGVRVGQVLKLQGPDIEIEETPGPELVSARLDLPAGEFHTVASGESLYSIARKYGLSVSRLKEINSLERDAVNAGQKLKVK